MEVFRIDYDGMTKDVHGFIALENWLICNYYIYEKITIKCII